jgi:hypothetical protein
MGQRGRKSRHRGRSIAVALTAATAGLSLAASAWAAPAVDEYNSRLPDSSGEKTLGPRTPVSQPTELPSAVREQLNRSPDGPKLTEIATADELKAPPPAKSQIDDVSTDADSRGVLPSAFSGIGDPLGILLILGLAGITTAAVLRRRSNAGRGGTFRG